LQLLRRLLPYLTRYRRGLVWGGVCILLANFIALIQPQVLRLAVDDLYHGVTAQKLARYAVILLVIAVGSGIFKYLMREVVIGISRHIEFDLRNDFFARLQSLSQSYFHRTRTGEIMSRGTNDLAAVRMMIGPGIMYLVNTAAVGLVSLVLMVHISLKLTVLSLLPLPLVSFAVQFFGDRIHHRFEAIQEVFAQISARVQENLSGVRVVRAYTREVHEVESFAGLNQDYVRKNLGLIQSWGVFYPALAFLTGLAALLALYLGGREVVAQRITLGEFVAFTVYLGMLNWPMIALGSVINMIQRGTASLRRLLEVLDEPPAITSAPGAVRPASCSGTIEFRHLTFVYPGATRPALRDLNLAVPAGATVALVGRTGCGKSTALALLPRVFEPPPGTVFLDGRDVRALDLDWLRAQIGYVQQEPFLFSATVAENVAYGAPDAPRTDVEWAARLAALTADVERLPERFETRVGERGVTLSGGQKQRVAIARALLRRAPILLLDDCLSSVDTETEEAILEGLRVQMRDRTALLVSHRVSTVRHADQIVVLAEGAIAERGTHDELVRRGGRYAELALQQQLEEELEAS
jgi:ATP-binding cassette subfamily B protein